tara:strand:- start:608 stop:811 length:204 start_codon:yes stop_codon:yes gene_type:complete
MKRWRHFLVTLLTIPFLIIYVWIALAVIDLLTGYNFIIDCIIYLTMGLLWLFPASIVVKWLANNEAH